MSARDLSDAFESLVILSWAAHDLVNFVYYSFSGTSRFYILFMWWLFSVIIIVQSTYYLLVQIRIFCSRPRSHSVEYALALFAWSVGVMLWEFGDFYAPEDQDPENIFEEPTNSRNMRWYCFWTIVAGAFPLLVWCARRWRYIFQEKVNRTANTSGVRDVKAGIM